MTDIHLATILSPHGIKGWVKVFWHGAEAADLMRYKTLHDKSGRAFEVEDARIQPKNVTVKFKGVDDRSAAETLAKTDLFIPRTSLPALAQDEFYHTDLIGLAVQNTAGEHLGTLRGIQNFGAGDLLEIQTMRGDTEFLPFTDGVVKKIDFEAEVITIIPPTMVE